MLSCHVIKWEYAVFGPVLAHWMWMNMTNWKKEHLDESTQSIPLISGVAVQILHTMCRLNKKKKTKVQRKMKGEEERELEGRGRTSSYLELLSCNLLERRQERYKQKSQTDSFWLWAEWNISYLVAKWQSVLIVHNTATTLRIECWVLNHGKSLSFFSSLPLQFISP